MKRLVRKEGDKIISCLWPDDENPEGWDISVEDLEKKEAPKKRGRPKKVENEHS